MKKRYLKLLFLPFVFLGILIFNGCSKVSFKINFIVDNECCYSINTNGNETLSMPVDPEKEGYIFDGWYWDNQTWNKPFTINSLLDATLSSDLNVYAKFISEICDYDMSGVSFDDATFVFDGKEHELKISGNLPEGVSVSYSDNKLTNVGTIEATASFVGDDKHNSIPNMNATLTITKANYDMNGISFNDSTFVYDGNEHELKISGSLPDGVSVSYKNNKLTNAGSIEATASFIVDNNHNSIPDLKATITVAYDLSKCEINSIDGGTIDNKNLYLNIRNSIKTVDLSELVHSSEESIWYLYKDINCQNEIPSMIASNLSVGNNYFYILVKSGNGKNRKIYTLNIYKNHLYTITYDYNGGEDLDEETVEEGFCATSAPLINEDQTYKIGYTFVKWDFDFSNKIYSSRTIDAIWTPNTNTEYTINYYLENLEDDDYTLDKTVKLEGTTNTEVIADIIEYDHFTYNNIISNKGVILGDGSLVIEMYYKREIYKVEFDLNGGVLVNGEIIQYIKFCGSVRFPIFKKDGYHLTGYDLTDNYIIHDTTIILNWDIENYELHINTDGGYIGDSCMTFNVDNIITFDFIPIKNGYYFNGWLYNDKNIESTEGIYEDIEIIASWDGLFTTNNGTITGIKKTYLNKVNAFIIPSFYENVEIYSIGASAFKNTSIKNVEIESGIQNILDYAFYNCSSLEQIILPETILHIGLQAFACCNSLTSITIPSSIYNNRENLSAKIGRGILFGCSNLDILIIPNFFGRDSSAFTKTRYYGGGSVYLYTYTCYLLGYFTDSGSYPNRLILTKGDSNISSSFEMAFESDISLYTCDHVYSYISLWG